MWKKTFGFLIACSLETALANAATLTVDLNGGADYTDIQSAIDAAADGDMVLVKPGEYVITEPINFNRLHDPDDPVSPPVKNIVVRSEGGAEVTTIRMSETPANPDRASVVVFENGEGGASVLEGLKIIGGKGTKYGTESWQVWAGGILCMERSSPTLTNCAISGNSAYVGGGVFCDSGSSPTLTNCTISGNSADQGSGGVCCAAGSSPTMTDCTISGNSAKFGCGGLACWGNSSPTLTNCSISGNSAAVWGCGGLACEGNSSPTLTNCTISGNFASPNGGGVFCSENSSPTLMNCLISGNSATGNDGVTNAWGGGGLCCFNSSPILTNCTISWNFTEGGGSGIFCNWDSSPTVTNCTIAQNFGGYGAVCCGENSSPTLTNCIVWDNTSWDSIGQSANGNPEIAHSCIEGEPLWPGDGNINQDPLLCGFGKRGEVWVDPSWPAIGDGSEGDPFSDPRQATEFSLALAAGSPCLGAGRGGSDMGADNGRCDTPGETSRILHLATGTYRAKDFDLLHHVSLVGAARDRTVIEGTVRGLRTGSFLSDLSITKGADGGIVILHGESPLITNCTITENTATYGGGMYFEYGSSPTITNCTMIGNSAIYGGGVYSFGCSAPTITNCTISGNLAGQGGGVYLYCADFSPTLTNCTISGNSAGEGGAVYCPGSSSPTLTNCTISGNSAGWGGGVYCGSGSFPTLTNCTISGNAARYGGGVYCNYASPTLTNCIVWDNLGGSISLVADDILGRNPSVSNCSIQGDPLWSGQGNINTDPLFFQPGQWVECGGTGQPGCIAYQWNPDTGEETAWGRWLEGDYRLQPSSPCIDAGTAEGAPATDIEGNQRPSCSGVDMGAYEFVDCARLFQRFIRGDANADSAGDISDAVAVLSYLFLGENRVPCEQAGDANDDGALDISDAVYVLGFLFLGGKPIEPPVDQCGVDPTGHDLPCASFPRCE